jgi:hypothetical protein
MVALLLTLVLMTAGAHAHPVVYYYVPAGGVGGGLAPFAGGVVGGGVPVLPGGGNGGINIVTSNPTTVSNPISIENGAQQSNVQYSNGITPLLQRLRGR